LDRLQIGANALDRPLTRLSPVPQIEDESRIADRIPAEASRCDPTVT